MREIVTLQLGHLSNYTSTHFWNAQVYALIEYSLRKKRLTRHQGVLLYIFQ